MKAGKEGKDIVLACIFKKQGEDNGYIIQDFNSEEMKYYQQKPISNLDIERLLKDGK